MAAAAGGNGIDNFVNAELETHACAICYEVMEPPDRAPILLFPCGHSFCKLCLAQHEKQYKKTCPLCRAKITSKALNFALQQIIINLAAKKKELAANAKQQQSTSATATAMGAATTDDAELALRYGQQYRMFRMRCDVLANKLTDLKLTAANAEAERAAGQLVVAHLQTEEEKVVSQIEALQSELQLIRKHRSEQQSKVVQLATAQADAAESSAQLADTLAALERDRDKARVLMLSLAPAYNPDLPLAVTAAAPPPHK